MSDLDAIRARRAAISPGRWYEDADEMGQDYIYLGTDGGRLYVGDMSETTGQEHCDAAFIAHAPSDIDALLARVAELEADNRHLHSIVAVTRGYKADAGEYRPEMTLQIRDPKPPEIEGETHVE